MSAFTIYQLKNATGNPPTAKTLVKHVMHPILKADTGKINTRHFNQDELKRLLDNPAFEYRQLRKEPPSLWDRFWNWFWHLFDGDPTPHHGSFHIPYLKYFLMAALIVAAIFIIIKLVGVEINNVFLGRSAQIPVTYQETQENIHEINFDDEIRKAVERGNYRLAVRLQYLWALKLLNDAHLIRWTKEKTNLAYINELNDAEQRNMFTTITRQFEYVWYGGFNIDGTAFANIKGLFDSFKTRLP
jgi:hypothetical protein